MSILKRITICWKHGHEWGDWMFQYPTYGSVRQRRECNVCSKNEYNWVLRPEEEYVPGPVRDERIK